MSSALEVSCRGPRRPAGRVERALEILGDTVTDNLTAAGKLHIEHSPGVAHGAGSSTSLGGSWGDAGPGGKYRRICVVQPLDFVSRCVDCACDCVRLGLKHLRATGRVQFRRRCL